MTGAYSFLYRRMVRVPKRWLNYGEQASLLAERGLTVEDHDSAAEFLSVTNYYRLSGYFRYWQRDPLNGDNRFIAGASFNAIRDLYLAEQALGVACDEILRPIEVMFRTRFAHSYAELVGPVGVFAVGEGFTQPPDLNHGLVHDHALSNLDRSKEPFIGHYREEIKTGRHYDPAAYAQMPIWVAVEAFTFGTISRLITASGKSGVLDAIAESLGVSRATLPSQVRSFVYLRNRVAHSSRLWNHSVLDVPGLLPNTSRRAKRNHRQFDDHSIYKIFVALEYVARGVNLDDDWLSRVVDPILDHNRLLAAGICTPKKFGQMSTGVLVSS